MNSCGWGQAGIGRSSGQGPTDTAVVEFVLLIGGTVLEPCLLAGGRR